MRSSYGFDKPATLKSLRASCRRDEIAFEDEPAIEEALFRWNESAAGFVDCLIAAHNRRLGCSATATFDVTAARVQGFVAA